MMLKMNLTWVEMLLILLNFLHVEDYYHQTFLVLFVSSALVTYWLITNIIS